MSRITPFSFVAAFCALQVSVAFAQFSDGQTAEVSGGQTASISNGQAVETVADEVFCNAGDYGQGGVTLRTSIDFLMLDRHDTNGGAFLFDFVTGQPLLDFNDVNGPAETGLRFGLTFLEDPITSTEFSYFQMDYFGGSQNVQSANLITFPFFTGVPATPESAYTVAYISRFEGFEANRRRQWTDRIEGLMGFRFFNLEETFNISSPNGVFGSGIDNDLFGFQIGGEIQLWRFPYSRLVTTLKSGVYYNNSDIAGQAVNPSNGQPMRFIIDADEVAYVAELQFGLWVPMGSHANMNIGYQGFYLDGVGLAPQQLDNASIFTGQGTFDGSSVWFHGGYIGIAITW